MNTELLFKDQSVSGSKVVQTQRSGSSLVGLLL